MGRFRCLLRLGMLAMVLMVQCQATNHKILKEDLAFKGHEQLREVKCGMKYDADTNVNVITLQNLERAANPLITLKSLKDDECTTSFSFAACTVTDTVKEVRLIVTDLAEGETRQYNCTINGFHGVTAFMEEVNINVTRPEGPTVTTGSNYKTAHPEIKDEDAGYMSDVGQYQQPWGQPLRDPEILSHMSTLQRPNPRVVKIPNFEAASANPPDDGTPPSVYQDGPASLNDAE